ncbi:MAG: hypothetical protein F6K19_34070 [Cyanothece sp. SIO1E1]|nr:hypothetical protein [Cyanothece sp. SIO1E1]
MPDCPRCHQPIDVQAVSCPYCRTQLKAFGHQGMPLYRAEGEAYLCQTCMYHADDTCNFPQRPYAKTCTLYLDQAEHDLATKRVGNSPKYQNRSIRLWLQRHAAVLILVGLILISFLIALG